MPRRYNVPFTGTLTNAGGNSDLWIFIPADDKPLSLVGFWLGQVSEVADAAEEAVQLSVIHMTATVTDGNGTSVTPVKAGDQNQAAAGFTSEYLGATVATTNGTSTTLAILAWNIRASPVYFPFDDSLNQPRAPQGEAIVIRCDTTVADDVTLTGTAVVDEF